MTLRADGTADVRACIDDTAAGFGGALALGDVDDDDQPDLVVGNGTAAGRADEIRVYGSAGIPAAPECDGTWGMDPIVVPCPADLDGIDCAGSGFGSTLAVGDVNADGIDDVIAGAPFADVDGETDAGAVYVMPGAGAGPSSAGAVVLTHSSPVANDRVGTLVSAVATGLATGLVRRVEPVASAPGSTVGGVGQATLLVFLCSGLPGDAPDTVGERCVPQ
jgi:hypothetical protein